MLKFKRRKKLKHKKINFNGENVTRDFMSSFLEKIKFPMITLLIFLNYFWSVSRENCNVTGGILLWFFLHKK